MIVLLQFRSYLHLYSPYHMLMLHLLDILYLLHIYLQLSQLPMFRCSCHIHLHQLHRRLRYYQRNLRRFLYCYHHRILSFLLVLIQTLLLLPHLPDRYLHNRMKRNFLHLDHSYLHLDLMIHHLGDHLH